MDKSEADPNLTSFAAQLDLLGQRLVVYGELQGHSLVRSSSCGNEIDRIETYSTTGSVSFSLAFFLSISAISSPIYLEDIGLIIEGHIIQ